MIFIAENLRHLRLAHGLTQEELAASLGVSDKAVSRWETGAVCPDIELLPGLANFFNVSLDELCGMEKLRSPGTLRHIFDEECSKRASGDIQGAIETLRTLCELTCSPEPTATLAKGLTSDLSDDEMLKKIKKILRTDAAR